MIHSRLIRFLLFACFSFPLCGSFDIGGTGSFYSNNVELGGIMTSNNCVFNVKNKINITGVAEGKETVALNGGVLAGNGIIRGPKITIRVRIFAFIGTIECSGECVIITEEPFNKKMFKRKGKGKFIFQQSEKAFYVSPSGRALYGDVNSKSGGETALMIAAGEGDALGIEQLLAKGADVNAKSDNGAPVLLYAIEKNDLTVVKMLVQRGADVNAKNDSDGGTPVILASDRGHLDIVTFLVDHGAEVNAQEKKKVTALMTACAHGYLDIVSLLVQHGADVNAKNDNGAPVLLYAILKNEVNAAKILVQHGADVNFRDVQTGMTLLLEAVTSGLLDSVKFLVEQKADVNMKDANGVTPLMFASDRGHLEMVTFLVEHGADVTATTHDGQSALTVAANKEIQLFLQSWIASHDKPAASVPLQKVTESALVNLARTYAEKSMSQTESGMYWDIKEIKSYAVQNRLDESIVIKTIKQEAEKLAEEYKAKVHQKHDPLLLQEALAFGGAGALILGTGIGLIAASKHGKLPFLESEGRQANVIAWSAVLSFVSGVLAYDAFNKWLKDPNYKEKYEKLLLFINQLDLALSSH